MDNKIINKFFRYTSQNIIGMIGISCYILADTFFVSKGLGADGLTALNIALPMYSFVHGLGLMIGIGGGTVYSISRVRSKETAEKVFTASLALTLIFSAIFMFIGTFFSGHISNLLGAEGNIFDMTKTYMQTLLTFAPAFMLNNLFLCFIRNDGAPSLTMVAMLSGSIANIILDYIFIFPLNMGIFGAAAATGISPIISLVILSSFMIKKKNTFHLRKCKIPFKLIYNILSSGLPSLVTELSSGIVMIVFNMIILNIAGNIGVAAYGIVANISLVIISIFTGLSQGIQPLISDFYGKNNIDAVNKIFRYASITVLAMSIVIYAVIFFECDVIVNIFNSEKNIALKQLGETGLKCYFTSTLFAGMNIITSIYFTSTESPLPAHIISLLRGFIFIIPVTFLMSFLFKMTGVYFSFPLSEFLVCIIGTVIYIKKRRQTV